MTGIQRVLYSVSICLMLLLSGILGFQPSEGDSSEVGLRILPSSEYAMAADPPGSDLYDGNVLNVGGFGPGNYTSIQDALDDAEDHDQVWVYSRTYSEVLTVRDEIWIKAAAGSKLLNPGGLNDGITLEAHNVTLTGLNITDFNIGIYSTFSGHNISNNVLWMNENGIIFEDATKNLDHDHSNFGYIIWDNSIIQKSSLVGIEIDVMLDFDDNGPYNFLVDDILIADNYLLSYNSDMTLVKLVMNVRDIGKGDGRIGNCRFIRNQLEGGRSGIVFSGELMFLKDLDLDIGDLEMIENILVDYSLLGVRVNYYLLQVILGNSTFQIGDIIMTGNQVASSLPSTRGIVLDPLYSIMNIEDSSTLEFGNLSFKDNTIDVLDNAIMVSSPNIGYGFNDMARVSIGESSFMDNRILRSLKGIRYEMSGLGIHIGSTSLIFQGIVIDGNSIRSTADSIEIITNSFGFYLSENARVDIDTFSIHDNWIRSDSTGIYLSIKDIGNGVGGSSSLFWGGLNISGNTIISVTGIDFKDLSRMGSQLYNDTMVTIGNISLYGNVISTTGTGIHTNEISDLGSNLEDGSHVEVGEFGISENLLDCGGGGIHIYGFNQDGYRMSDNSAFDFRGLNILSNEIISDSNGIEIGHMTDLGSYLNNYSSATVGDLNIIGNTIRSNVSGIYLGNLDNFGNYLYDFSTMVLGTFEISWNDIASNETGIMFVSYSMNGYMLGDESSARFGELLIVNNTVVSRFSSGLNFGQYMHNGFNLLDNSTVTLGKLSISGNIITSEYSAMFFYHYGYLGYILYNYSMAHIGALEIRENKINSRGEGLVIFGLYYICYVLFNYARAIYDGVNISGNIMTSFANGIYISGLGSMGYVMRDRSTSVVGAVRLDDNVIKTKGNGIQIDQIFGIGYDLSGNSGSTMEGFSFSGNIIDASEQGIWISSIIDINKQLVGDSTSFIGNFSMISNVIGSGKDGIRFDSMEDVNSVLNNDAKAHLGVFKATDNKITASNGYGLSFLRMSLWGSGNRDTTYARMDGFEISRNEISSNSISLYLEFRQLGGYMDGDARFELGPILIEKNDIASDWFGMLVDFNGLSDSISGSASIIVEEVEISGNQIDAEDAINMPIEIGIPSAKAKVLFGDVIVSDNSFERSRNYSLFIPLTLNIVDDVRVEMGDMHFLWNDIKGSDTWGINLYHQIITTSTIPPKFGDIEIMGNSIEDCANGLYLNHTKNVTVFANNFVKNVNDTVIDDTAIRWVSRQPMWYRHGMRNFTSYLGNYWDRYTGSDSNDDGIGDTPYNTGSGMDTHPLMDRVEEYLPPWNDVTPPTVVITSPTNGSALNFSIVKMTWVGTDDLLGIEHYEVRLDSGAWSNVLMSMSHTFTELDEGGHDLFVKAVDMAGNERTVSVHIIIDLSGPGLVILEPADDGFINSSRVHVSWEMMDEVSGIASSMVKLDNGSWMDTGKLDGFLFTNVSQGYHYVEVKVIDNAGNFLMERTDFGVDLTSPLLSILYPVKDLFLASTSLNAEWQGSDGFSGVSEFRVRMDNGIWVSKDKVTDHMFMNLSWGDHILDVMLFDRAGNHIQTSTGFEVGSVEHILSILRPLEGSYLSNSTVNVAWEAFGTTYAPLMYQIRVGSGDWEYLPVVYSYNVTGLSDGNHTVFLKLTDKGGNVETASATFIVDTIAPTILSISHSGNRAPPGDPIVIVFSEIMDPAGLIIEVNDMRLPGNLTPDGLELTINADMGLGIDVTVDIKGSDLAGNILVEQRSFKTASTGTITGKVIDTKGKPLIKARILLDTKEEVTTDMNGEFTLDATPGLRTVRIYDEDGHKLAEFKVEVVAGKTVTPTDHLTVERYQEPAGSNWWIWLIVILALIAVILGAAAFIIMRRRAAEEDEDEYDWDEDEDEDEDEEDYDSDEYDEEIEYGEDWDDYEE